MTTCNWRINVVTGLFGAVLLCTDIPASANSTAADDEQWGQWRPMASGYVARRRQPEKLEKTPLTRRPEAVQPRQRQQLKQQLRLEQRLDESPVAAPRSLSGGAGLPAEPQQVSARVQASAPTGHVQAAWLHTEIEGLFEIPVAELAVQLNQSENKVRQSVTGGALRVSRGDSPSAQQANQPVAWHYDEDSDSILIPAPDFETFYTSEDAYRLRLGGAGSKLARPMPVASGNPPSTAGAPTPFREHLSFEEEPDMLFLTWVVADEPDADYWFWDYLFAGSRESISLPLNVPFPAAQGTAQLQVVLRGFTDLGIPDEHRVQAAINGQLVGSVNFSGMRQGVINTSFDQSLLNTDGANVLELFIEYDAGTTPGQFLDEIQLTYDRLPIAQNDTLWLHEAAGGIQSVTGLTSEDLVVIERPEDGNAILRDDITIEPDQDGTWQVSFNSTQGRDYLVTTRASTYSGMLSPDYRSGLDRAQNRADYLVIAPRDFGATAQALANYRGATFGRVSIAWLEDIYDEYSAGREDPAALSRFMRRVVSRWQLVPQAVVLLGKGSLDHKDRMGYADNFLPVRLVATPYALAVSDSRLLGFEDRAPFAIGRLPIINDAEGQAYVQKLSRYEEQGGNQAYRALLVADNPDDGGNFPANTTRTAAHLLNTLGFAEAAQLNHPQDDVRDALAQTAAWSRDYVIYDGHGSVAQAGDALENFMLATEVTSLANTQLPVFTALTCAVGDHSYPATRSLAGALVLNPGGGAIASMAPSGLSLDREAQLLGEAFTDGLFLQGNSVGVALQDAKLQTDDTIPKFMLRMYNVVGEPGVTIR